nr:MAG TPA: hypothetical protein [Caudoviricetes sp.]
MNIHNNKYVKNLDFFNDIVVTPYIILIIVLL